MFKLILVPTDGSEGVSEAVNCAVALAKKFDAAIHLLFVVEPPRVEIDYGSDAAVTKIMQSVHDAGRQIVDEAAESVSQSGIGAVTPVVLEGNPAEEIVRYARENGADLIVMGTHGRRGLGRVLVGSVAEEVVRSADVPVMTVRMSSK